MPHIKRGSQPVSPSGNHCLQNPSCKASHDGTIFIYFVILKIKHHFLLIMSENGWFSLSNVALNIRTINSMIGNIFLLYIYIFVFLFLCLFGSNKRPNGSADPNQVFVEPHMNPKKVYACSELQKVVSKNFNFVIWNPQNKCKSFINLCYRFIGEKMTDLATIKSRTSKWARSVIFPNNFITK